MKQKMMIYHTIATGLMLTGAIEKVWGHEMLTTTIDASDKEAVDEAKRDGWVKTPAEVIEQIEAKKMQSENLAMKKQIALTQSGVNLDTLMAENATLKQQVSELQQQVSQLTEQLNSPSSNTSVSTVKKPVDKVKADPKADSTQI